ncbi:MAG: hypothetical protein Q9191_002878 [Dirinaria sp. TL-2023a]
MLREPFRLKRLDVRKSSKKTVRIISPHSTSSDNGSRMPEVLFSPPPRWNSPRETDADSVNGALATLPDDPFNAESDDEGVTTEDENLRRNTISNARPEYADEAAGSTRPSRVGGKPIAQVAVGMALPEEGESSISGLADAGAKSKPHYSVDEFTNLLMTGKRQTLDGTTATTPPVTSITSPTLGDSSSNTDSSSISRQSMFEPSSDARQETPRTSHELSLSDEERQNLVKASPIKRSKPTAPKSHHGKLVSGNASQAGLPREPSSPATSIRSKNAVAGPFSPSPPRTPTDLNKPLPPPPTREAIENVPLASQISPDTEVNFSTPNQKKEPPVPPSARRQGQPRPKSIEGKADRSVLVPEVDSSAPEKPSLVSSELGGKAPPPPPPRRPGPIRGLSTSSSTSSMSMIPTPSSSVFSDEIKLSASKNKPPVPPARNRAGSSAKRQSTLPAPMGFSGMPPAPPPRRRGSSQSSFSPSQLSAEYQPSITERQRADSGASSIQSKDVMADLSALQREVDELRATFGT